MTGKADYVDEGGTVVRPYPTYPFEPARLADECYVCQPAAFVRRAQWACTWCSVRSWM